MDGSMKPKQLIVFDMDGVIIDVSGSYRETVRQTARLFFKGARSWEDLPNPLFPLEDLARVKQSGGLNNDWDLSCFVISLLFSRVKSSRHFEEKNNDSWGRYGNAVRDFEVADLVRFILSEDKPLTMLMEEKGKHFEAFIASLFTGDVGSGNIIKQIFQEIYLGKDLFESTYGMSSRMYHGEGYINREKLLIEKSTLEELYEDHILAIATGRPAAEAEYPLDYFGLRKYFKILYALDDCIREERSIKEREGITVSLSKPHPFMLDAIAEVKKHEVSGLFYIGDMPDDMIAASRSAFGFKGIGILLSAPDRNHLKEELIKAGADYIIEDFDELKGIIASG